MSASSHFPHRRGRTSTPTAPTKLPAKPHGARRVPSSPAVDRVLLVEWTTIFPLSAGPAERVRRHVAAGTGVDDLTDVIASYLRELDDRVPAPCTVDADGNLLGPHDFAADAGDILFRAVFMVDLEAMLGRRRTPEPVPATPASG